MKKWFLFLLSAVLLLSACGEAAPAPAESNGDTSSEPPVSTEPDTEPPVLRINKSVREVTIKKGATFDLMQGVTAKDNVDGKIEDRVEINDGGFDPNVPGVYTIGYFVADSAGNAAEAVFRTITVMMMHCVV